MNFLSYLGRSSTVALTAILLAACGSAAYREGHNLAADGNLEAALPRLKRALDEDSLNAEYRAAYLRTRERLLNHWQEQANRAQQENRPQDAARIYQRIEAEDPGNARARNGLLELERLTRHTNLMEEAESALKKQDDKVASARLRTLLNENPDNTKAASLRRSLEEKTEGNSLPPRLNGALRVPVTLQFRETPIRQIFEILSRTSGLNFVMDKDVKGDQRATIFLRKTSVQDALNLLMLTNQLEYRALDANSILIYPSAIAKQKDYQPLYIRTFLLSNCDAKSASNILKTILKAKDVVVDEKRNLVVMRDTIDAIRIAERLLAIQDRAEPEVMLEVAVLEVSRSRLINLGVQWPSQLALAPLANSSGNVTLADLRDLHPAGVGATLPAMTVMANKQDSDVNILANPSIRARNQETAKIMIGDRVPNITTTSTATGFVSESVQYADVGLKLEVQPVVYADNEVAIKISLEVSSIVKQVQTKSGSLAYQIGTRNASTLLKLRDGENQILAGLIRNEEISTGNRVPGFGDIPLLGRLFGGQSDSSAKTEIVLSITPRLIRQLRRPDANMLEFESGTDSNLRIPLILPPSAEGESGEPADFSAREPVTSVHSSGGEALVPPVAPSETLAKLILELPPKFRLPRVT